jgi:uncharacterized protein YegL
MSDKQLALVEFADNPQPRCPVVLVLDVSGSMFGHPIDELKGALDEFVAELKADSLAALRVELATVTFGGVVNAAEFVTADSFQAPELKASGDTPMGAAVKRGLTLLHDRKALYKQGGMDYFRPWMIIITDGEPTDEGEWEAAADQLRQEEARKGVLVYPIGVEKADLSKLARFSDQRKPLRLKGLAFRELFQWLSKSLSIVSQSRPGDKVALPPVGWSEVDTA